MKFETPAPWITFNIPDDWWAFADMADFILDSDFYPPDHSPFEAVPLTDIRPPARPAGEPLFHKHKLMPVLFAFRSPECSLPLAQLIELPEPGRYRFDVHNGFHRFYASVAAGFTHLPARVFPPSVLAAI